MSKIVHKTETLNLRVSAHIKQALRLAAEKEHRSMANMVEHLVLEYCAENNVLCGNLKQASHVPGTSN